MNRIEHSRIIRCLNTFIMSAAILTTVTLASRTAAAEDRVAEHKVPPVYPATARTLRLGGIVKVSVTINPSGAVTKAEAKGANRLLGTAAEEAVRKWKFASADSETSQDVEIVFKLD